MYFLFPHRACRVLPVLNRRRAAIGLTFIQAVTRKLVLGPTSACGMLRSQSCVLGEIGYGSMVMALDFVACRIYVLCFFLYFCYVAPYVRLCFQLLTRTWLGNVIIVLPPSV